MRAMRRLALLLLLVAGSAFGQVYRWVDANGTVQYSDKAPPTGVKAQRLSIEAKPGPLSPDTQECYTVRCQGERMEQRLIQREQSEARAAAERVANTPPRPHGLDFRKYVSVYRGMTEGELLTVAGSPDLLFRDWGWVTYTYLPATGDPFTTTIRLVGGRVSEIDRVRKF
jgi:hypothetical protein